MVVSFYPDSQLFGVVGVSGSRFVKIFYRLNR